MTTTSRPFGGRKFRSDGRVLPFPGSTIICHLPQQGDGFEAFDSVLDIYRELPDHAFSKRLAVLPPSSYHMTIIGTATGADRRWPPYVPQQASIEECNFLILERLAALKLECALPIRMTVDLNPQRPQHPISLDLKPLDEQETIKLRHLRKQLADALQLHIPNPDRYTFHLSVAYQMDKMTPEETADYTATMTRWRQEICTRAPVLLFGAPEFCTFKDMFAFRTLFKFQD